MSDSPSSPYTPGNPDVIVLDAKGLRALAHPVRVQLVGLLRKHGPSTATRLAERLGVNSGTASYHLRQLAAAGFVEEDTGRGNARERWWRSIHRSTYFEGIDLVEREPEVALAYLQSVAAVHTLRVQRAVNEFQTMPRPWRNAADMSDWALRLTPEETVRLRDELHDVLARYRRDVPEEAAVAPEGAERVGLITYILPELDAPVPGADPAGDLDDDPDGGGGTAGTCPS
ncbi:ArsR family transcriptional regulator [Microbispora triticiradicis]|uniref:ArsR family transcriptional regulator n=1 Tax=Microbispora triticiradicis TaxID=2200763 RepID=A0ABX9LS90_9ACTN|nr:helix-turn-helix domain-containing protein [Microbispora triticiradicis]RGA06403.1 ArsR family transcriptional regulator [Microbispora triticiradicis]